MSATEATVVAVTEEVKAVEPPAAEPTPATDAPSADQPAAVTEAAPATVCLPFTVLTCLILFFFSLSAGGTQRRRVQARCKCPTRH